MGISLGLEEGDAEGISLGLEEGLSLGDAEGISLGLEEGSSLGDAEGISLGFSLGDAERISLGDTEEPLPLPSPLPLPLLLTRDPLAFLILRLARDDWAKAAGAISSAEVAAAVANFILPVVGFQRCNLCGS